MFGYSHPQGICDGTSSWSDKHTAEAQLGGPGHDVQVFAISEQIEVNRPSWIYFCARFGPGATDTCATNLLLSLSLAQREGATVTARKSQLAEAFSHTIIVA